MTEDERERRRQVRARRAANGSGGTGASAYAKPGNGRQVELMAAAGMEHEEIAEIFQMPVREFQNVYREELLQGIHLASAKVTGNIYRIATSWTHPKAVHAAAPKRRRLVDQGRHQYQGAASRRAGRDARGRTDGAGRAQIIAAISRAREDETDRP